MMRGPNHDVMVMGYADNARPNQRAGGKIERLRDVAFYDFGQTPLAVGLGLVA